MMVVMTFTKSFLLLSILVTASFGALAAEVYKTVDENGNIVFSDKPSADAETIKVQPNVVDVNIPKMPEPAVQEKPRTQTSTQSREVEQEMIGYGTAHGDNVRRRVRTETNGEGIDRSRPRTAPAGGRAGGGR
jgi:hypothetical protein